MNHRFATTSVRTSLFSLTCAALLSFSGCKKEASPEPVTQDAPAAAPAEPEHQDAAPSQSKAELAAQVAVEISKSPEQADAILAKHGLNRESLETLMFEIAKDPKLRAAYNAARRESLASR